MKKILLILILLLLPVLSLASYKTEVKVIKYYPSVMRIKMVAQLTESQRVRTGVGFVYYINNDKSKLYTTSQTTKTRGELFGRIKTITPDNDNVCIMSYAYKNDSTRAYSSPACTSLPKCHNGATLHPLGDNKYAGIVSLPNRTWYTGDYNSVVNQIGNQTANYCGIICYKGVEIHYDKLYKTYWANNLNNHSFFKKTMNEAKETIDRNYHEYGLDIDSQCNIEGLAVQLPQIKLIKTETTNEFGPPDNIIGTIEFEITAPGGSGIYIEKQYIYPILTPQYAGVEKNKNLDIINAVEKTRNNKDFIYISAGKTAKFKVMKTMTAKELKSVHYYLSYTGDDCLGYAFNMNDTRTCFEDLSRFTTEEQNINPGIFESPKIGLMTSSISKISGVYGKAMGIINFYITAPSYKPIYILEDNLKAQISETSPNILIQTVELFNAMKEGEYIKIEKGVRAEFRSYIEVQATAPTSVYAHLKTSMDYTDMDNNGRLIGLNEFKTTSVYIGTSD